MRFFRLSTRRLMLLPGLLTVAAVMLCFPRLCLARAGGGEGYHGSGGGGGGGGGHGGGGHGGDGGFFWLIIQFLIFHPIIGVPLLLLIVGLYYVYGRNRRTGSSSVGQGV